MLIDAAVLRAADSPYSIERVELAEPGPDEVLVRIAGAGMCHTDLLGRAGLTPTPIILGHEGSGVVEAVGPGVAGLAAGDHVVLSFDHCGGCANCRAGHPAYCAEMIFRNMSGFPAEGPPRVTDAAGEPVASRWFGQSSLATHALGTARNTIKVDPELPLELLGPLGCGFQTGAGAVLISLGVTAGSSVAVFGVGGVGMAAVLAARVAGATTIIAVDLHPARLELALELGATHAFHGSDEDLAAQITALTGDGVQYALDTTAVPDVVATAVASLRPTGVCGLVGVGVRDLVLNPTLLLGGRTVTGILEGDAVPHLFVPRLAELWKQDRMPFHRLITTYPLADIDRAEADTVSGATIKPVLLPTG